MVSGEIWTNVRAPLCIQVDKFVSGGIIKRGCWEKHIVMETMRGVDQYPTAVFLDIGANIGEDAIYTYVLGLAMFSDQKYCQECTQS